MTLSPAVFMEMMMMVFGWDQNVPVVHFSMFSDDLLYKTKAKNTFHTKIDDKSCESVFLLSISLFCDKCRNKKKRDILSNRKRKKNKTNCDAKGNKQYIQRQKCKQLKQVKHSKLSKNRRKITTCFLRNLK